MVGPREPFFGSASSFKNPSYRKIDSVMVETAWTGKCVLVQPAWCKMDANLVWRNAYGKYWLMEKV